MASKVVGGMEGTEDPISVADAAKRLGISRNDMHLVPVDRETFWGIAGYDWNKLQEWADQSPVLLVELQRKKSAAEQRREKRDYEFTKTGRRKKRFNPRPCPNCGNEMKVKDVEVSVELTLTRRENYHEDLLTLDDESWDDGPDFFWIREYERFGEDLEKFRPPPGVMEWLRAHYNSVVETPEKEPEPVEPTVEPVEPRKRALMWKTFWRCTKCAFRRPWSNPDMDEYGDYYTEDDDNHDYGPDLPYPIAGDEDLQGRISKLHSAPETDPMDEIRRRFIKQTSHK